MVSKNIAQNNSVENQCTIFIVIEQSHALSCEAQKAIKDSMEVLLERIRVWARDNHINTYIDCLEYSENAKWITSHGPEPIDEFIWEGINELNPDNSTSVCFGRALSKLDEKIKGFEQTHVPSLLFFFLAGTDSSDEYQHNAEQLRNNSLYVSANKLAINICCGVKSPMLSEITNSSELVITNSNLAEFLKIFFACHYQIENEDSNIKNLSNSYVELTTNFHTKEPIPLVEIVLPYTSVKLNEYKTYEFDRCQLGPCKPEVALSTAISLSIMDDNEWGIGTYTLLTNHMEEPIAVVKTIKPQRSCWIQYKDAQGDLIDGIEVIHDVNSDNSGKVTLFIKTENDCLYIKNTSSSDEAFVKVILHPEGSVFLDQHDKIYTADLCTCLMTFRDLLDWD